MATKEPDRSSSERTAECKILQKTDPRRNHDSAPLSFINIRICFKNALFSLPLNNGPM
jgi:hypothetical protein